MSLMLALSCFLLSDLGERKVVPVRLDAQHGVEFSLTHTEPGREGGREGRKKKKKNTTAIELVDRNKPQMTGL